MGGLWTALAGLLRLVPRPLRDVGYNLVGSTRYRIFGRTDDACPVVPARLRSRVVLD